MIFELTEKENVKFLITDEWLSVSHDQRYIDSITNIILNPTLCGLIVDSSELGYKDYQKNKYGLKAIDSFKSLMKKMNIRQDEFNEWRVYKIILS